MSRDIWSGCGSKRREEKNVFLFIFHRHALHAALFKDMIFIMRVLRTHVVITAVCYYQSSMSVKADSIV